MANNVDNVDKVKIISTATDPIYIGTGGYTIGRVDNTIVRDPITKIPKIPGSSLAGVWRYYVTLKLIGDIKDKQPPFHEIKKSSSVTLCDKLNEYNWNGQNLTALKDWEQYCGNQIAKINCAGQDNTSNESIESPENSDKNGNSGHCGHCIVCKAFGYSKKDQSSQGMLFFSDLNILFFPVYTRLAVKWITSPQLITLAGLNFKNTNMPQENKIILSHGADNITHLNLGWLNLEVEKTENFFDFKGLKIEESFKNQIEQNLVLVPDHLISQIINSNLEVRTSVSIDPITGAAKEGALFTSEAIPRATVFYGTIRVIDRAGLKEKSDIPSSDCVKEALKDSKCYFETLGIGGMTTRGFGRMRICLPEAETTQCESQQNGGSDE